MSTARFIAVILQEFTQSIFMACYTCRKTVTVGKARLAFTLIRIDALSLPLVTLEDFDTLWGKVNLGNWNNFGLQLSAEQLRGSGRLKPHDLGNCRVKDKRLEDDGPNWQVSLEQKCPELIILKWKNVSEIMLPGAIYFGPIKNQLWSLDRHMQVDVNSFGVKWAGLNYIVILGNQESQRRIPMDLAKFLQPFQTKVWWALVLTGLCAYAVFRIHESKPISGWLFWLISTLLE